MKYIYVLLLVCISTVQCAKAQVSADSVLLKIRSFQAENDSFYNDGLFPTQRRNKEDNNIYFTALICLTLQNVRHYVSENQQSIIDSILKAATANYALYKNRNGELTYNFWQTHPEQFMPNSRVLSKMERFRLPDDLDDTGLIYLTKNHGREKDSLVKLMMNQHVNVSNKKVKSIFKRYRKFETYFSWFGVNMKQDIDICVLANILLFTEQKDLLYNAFDEASLAFIHKVLVTDDHIKHPVIISPWYQNSATIIYTISRLIYNSENIQIQALKSMLVDDIKMLYPKAKNEVEKLLLINSLLLLGESDTQFIVNISNIQKDFKRMHFFYINPISGSHVVLKQVLIKRNIAHYYCEAYYWTLIYEYLILSQKQIF